jgi:hypothetical protein
MNELRVRKFDRWTSFVTKRMPESHSSAPLHTHVSGNDTFLRPADPVYPAFAALKSGYDSAISKSLER